jgi:hypothetical protein
MAQKIIEEVSFFVLNVFFALVVGGINASLPLTFLLKETQYGFSSGLDHFL